MLKPSSYLPVLGTILLIFEVVSTAGLPSEFAPLDLVSEVQDQLANLNSVVLGRISAAQDNFANYHSDLTSYSYNVLSLGEIMIDQVHATVSEELAQIKDLAAQANKDISRCTSGREQMINRLPDELKRRIDSCIVVQNEEASQILLGSIYVVDVTINKVHNLDYQLRLCGDSLLCLSPLVTQIETSMVTIPAEIGVEVDKTGANISDLKVIVGECRDVNVADFTGYVTDLVEQIATCANGIVR